MGLGADIYVTADGELWLDDETKFGKGKNSIYYA